MNIVRTHPQGLLTLQQQVNRLFDQFDQDLFGRFEELSEGTFSPAMDVKEDADAYVVQLEVPGVPRENIEIMLHEGMLTLRGSREPKSETQNGEFRRVERLYGHFARSVSLPRSMDAARVQANLADGVLGVRLPKSEASKPRQIRIGTTHQGQGSGNQTQLATTPSLPIEPQKEAAQPVDSPKNTAQAS